MARIESRRFAAPEERQRPSVAWRGAKAVGSFALAPVARLFRRLFLVVLIVFLLSLGYRSVSTKIHTPGEPTRVVSQSDGKRLALLRQAGQHQVTLQEGDLTAAIQKAGSLPTFPLRNGQVVLTPGTVEVFGWLKSPSVTALIKARPSVDRGRVVFTLEQVRLGQQSLPHFLFPLAKIPTLDQATIFTSAIVSDVERIEVNNGTVTLWLR